MSVSIEAQRILTAMNNGIELVEHGYSFDEYDSDIWFMLGSDELEDHEAVDELIEAGLITTSDEFANPMARKYVVSAVATSDGKGGT